MKIYIKKITQLWFSFCFSLMVSQFANASLLTLDFVASDYIEYETNNIEDSTSYFPIPSVDFQVVLDIDFTQPPKGQPFFTTDNFENKLVIVEYEGKRYSTKRSTYDVSFSTDFSPFTNELQDLMPSKTPDNPYYSNSLDSFYFINRVVTDLSTGEILQEESSQLFYFNYGFGYQNEINGPNYNYDFLFGIDVPKVFDSIDPVSLSSQELQEILSTRTDLSLRFNETYSELVYDYDYDNGLSTGFGLGYVGDGTFLFFVSEPSSLLIIFTGLLFFSRELKYKFNRMA